MFKIVHLVFDLLQASEGGKRRFMHRRSFFKMNMLRQQTKFQSARAHNFAVIGRLLAGHEAKNCCLAGAISTDQTHMLAGIDLQRRAAQNILNAVGFMNV